MLRFKKAGQKIRYSNNINTDWWCYLYNYLFDNIANYLNNIANYFGKIAVVLSNIATSCLCRVICYVLLKFYYTSYPCLCRKHAL